MRVVAGRYRGKNIQAPKGTAVRPTTTRLKETLFNILQGYVAEARVLDLFAGSGALGIECISRGASYVAFVDKSKDSASVLRDNLKGIDADYDIFNVDFMTALCGAEARGAKFDLIFIDPPYASGLGEIAIDEIIRRRLLNDQGIIVFEHGDDKTYSVGDQSFKQRTKKMGTVVAEFISRKSVAVMSGSFDPFTSGHEAVLDEALRRFDEVVVACLVNPDKTYTFTQEQRLELVNAVCSAKKGAIGVFSDKYAVDVARQYGARALVRGIRDQADAEYETAMAEFNKAHGFDTEFIELPYLKNISSSAVKAQLVKGDFSGVPTVVAELLKSAEYADRLKRKEEFCNLT